jgi:hypothetical protein
VRRALPREHRRKAREGAATAQRQFDYDLDHALSRGIGRARTRTNQIDLADYAMPCTVDIT